MFFAIATDKGMGCLGEMVVCNYISWWFQASVTFGGFGQFWKLNNFARPFQAYCKESIPWMQIT